MLVELAHEAVAVAQLNAPALACSPGRTLEDEAEPLLLGRVQELAVVGSQRAAALFVTKRVYRGEEGKVQSTVEDEVCLETSIRQEGAPGELRQ